MSVWTGPQSDLKHPSQTIDGLFHEQLHMVIYKYKYKYTNTYSEIHLDQIQLTFCFLGEPETQGQGLARTSHIDTQTYRQACGTR